MDKTLSCASQYNLQLYLNNYQEEAMKYIKGSLTLMLLLLLLMANKIGESIFFLHYNRYSLYIKTYNHRAADNLGVTDIAIKNKTKKTKKEGKKKKKKEGGE